jgi:DNA-binding transcriptional LysR family regulator
MKLNEIDLNKLQTFLVLAQNGSMTEAGKILLRTPSAISQSISRLEASLSVQLFRRVGIKLYLTDEGKELAAGLVRYQSELGTLLGGLSRQQRELRGAVRLGLPPGFSATRIGPALAQLMEDGPQIQLKLRFQSQAELAEGLAQGSLDIALSLQPLDRLNRNLTSSQLYEEELILVTGQSPVRRSCTRITGEEVEKLPVIEYYQAPAVFRQWVRFHFGTTPKTIHTRAYASTLEYVLELVRRKVGVAVVPREAVATEIKRGRLHEIKGPQKRSWMGSVWMNQAKSAYLSPACVHLQKTLK